MLFNWSIIEREKKQKEGQKMILKKINNFLNKRNTMHWSFYMLGIAILLIGGGVMQSAFDDLKSEYIIGLVGICVGLGIMMFGILIMLEILSIWRKQSD